MNKKTKKKKIHPLQMPLRVSPSNGKPICRFHNYFGECKKHLDPQTNCPLDHSSCHVCLATNHLALHCPLFINTADFQRFQETYTLLNTRPSNYPTKTVLGNPIVWFDKLEMPPPPLLSPHNNNNNHSSNCILDNHHQLHRCRKLKRKEAEILARLPTGSTVLDVGAHFGDSILTLALYAQQSLKRNDLDFVAIEPSEYKCSWIRKVAKANNVSIRVLCFAVGDRNQRVQEDPLRKERALLDGSLMYKELSIVDNGSNDDDNDDEKEEDEEETQTIVEMITLDSLLIPHVLQSDEDCSVSNDDDDKVVEEERRRQRRTTTTIGPLGLLHIDVEGWESRVLQGAKTLLSEPNCSQPCFVIAEAWSDKDCQRRGVAEQNPVEQIEAVMASHKHFERQDDIVDIERNLVYARL